MNERKKKLLRMTASMEGEAVIVANIGKKIELSEMEIICLVNFAEVGVMSVFAAMDGPTGDDAEQSLNAHLDRIRKEFGITRLSASTCSLLRGKLFKYLA